MTRTLFILFWFTLWGTANAQQFRRLQPVTSVTKQFSAIWKLDRAPRPIASGKNGVPAVVRVNAHSLIFFAEETKKRLLRELGVSDLWSGHVMLRIIDLPPETKPVLERQAFGEKWRYQLTVPEELPSRQLLHAMVSLLLEEYAGRYSRKAPRIPPWLTEGFTELLIQKNGATLFTSLTLNRANILFQPDVMRRSRVVVQKTAPVSYLNLSLPPAELQLGAGLVRYRAHAHLFTSHLLARNDGTRRMQFFIRETNRRANSQHALLAAFDFKSMLAAEQWWSLTQTRFRNRDAHNRWKPGVALGHLANLLSVEAGPRMAANPCRCANTYKPARTPNTSRCCCRCFKNSRWWKSTPRRSSRASPANIDWCSNNTSANPANPTAPSQRPRPKRTPPAAKRPFSHCIC